MSNEKIIWLVEGLLPAVGTSIIGAPPKTGKSILARQLCAAVHNGDPFLGRESMQGRALYFSTQESASNIASHFKAMDYGTMPAVIALRRVERQNAIESLDKTLEENPGFKLVVIDMIVDFLPVTDTNDYEETRKVFAGIATLADKYQLHVAVTHHSKKVKQENSVHDLLGSTAMPASVDQVIMLSVDRAKNRYLTSSQRYGDDIEETSLNWNADRRLMSLGRTADELVLEQRTAAKERIEQSVMQFVLNHPSCTRLDVLSGVAGDQNIKVDALELFEQSGMIDRSGSGKKGDPFTFREVQLQTV
jgi:RecA-family ATPase